MLKDVLHFPIPIIQRTTSTDCAIRLRFAITAANLVSLLIIPRCSEELELMCGCFSALDLVDCRLHLVQTVQAFLYDIHVADVKAIAGLRALGHRGLKMGPCVLCGVELCWIELLWLRELVLL